jgi:hypothetical protein
MRKMLSMGALVAVMLCTPAILPAQSSNPDSQNGNAAMKPADTTATGCLAAGKKAGSFVLTSDDGTKYWLHSKSTNLADHVGHTVTVSGHAMTGQKKGDAAPSSADPNAGQDASGAASSAASHNMIMVKTVTMVSDSCKSAAQ